MVVVNIGSTKLKIEDRTKAVIMACLVKDSASWDNSVQKNIVFIAAKMMNNDLIALMGDKWIIADLNKYRPDLQEAMTELCYLRALELISAKHSKEILQAIWNLPYLTVIDYVVKSGLLKETEGSELLEIIRKVVTDNPKVVKQILDGKNKAIGFLVGQVMKIAKGKANPQQVQEMIKGEIEQMDDSLKDLYQEVILDHAKNPRNFRIIDNANCLARGHNPLCGDSLVVFLLTDDKGLICDVSFKGTGCAISLASASMMTEMLKGKTREEAEKLFNIFHNMCTEDDYVIEENNDNIDRLQVLAGVKNFPMRVKCATLAWHTMDAAINNKKEVTTE